MAQVTFICNPGEYEIADLIAFTRRTGALVVVRGVCVIDDGIVDYMR